MLHRPGSSLRSVARAALAASVVALPLVVSACQSTAPRDDATPPPTKMQGSRWALVALEAQPVDAEPQITLELGADGRVAGFAGVNRYSGEYRMNAGKAGGALAFSPLVSSKMAGPPEQQKLEDQYMSLLQATTGYRAEGGLMELLADGRPTLRFRQLGAGG